MENNPHVSARGFLKNEVLKLENRQFWAKILSSAVGYFLVSLWLDNIRATAPLWFVWVLIIVQFALYFRIFISSYQRSMVLGLNRHIAIILFVALAFLGRVNDWEAVIIPLLIVVMLACSVKSQRVSDWGNSMLPRE